MLLPRLLFWKGPNDVLALPPTVVLIMLCDMLTLGVIYEFSSQAVTEQGGYAYDTSLLSDAINSR